MGGGWVGMGRQLPPPLFRASRPVCQQLQRARSKLLLGVCTRSAGVQRWASGPKQHPPVLLRTRALHLRVHADARRPWPPALPLRRSLCAQAHPGADVQPGAGLAAPLHAAGPARPALQQVRAGRGSQRGRVSRETVLPFKDAPSVGWSQQCRPAGLACSACSGRAGIDATGAGRSRCPPAGPACNHASTTPNLSSAP